nr:hypothetical protein GCM10020093_066550 [Planobispora longispora]
MSTDFAEWLRGRSDEQLRELVALRPELITPVPAHVEGLAGRASSPSAVGRVLDRLDRFTFAVMETVAVLPSPIACAPLRDQVARALPEPRGRRTRCSRPGSGRRSTGCGPWPWSTVPTRPWRPRRACGRCWTPPRAWDHPRRRSSATTTGNGWPS